MLGALGIMRAIGGYVMRTAFRRVHHAFGGLCLNRFTTCCALTLGHFSGCNRPSLSFLLAYHV